MFNAVSKCVYGNEDFHLELRLRASVHLILNLDQYCDEKNYPEHFLAKLVAMSREFLQVESYRICILKEAKRCLKVGEWASPIIFYGLANALGIEIQQIHPCLSDRVVGDVLNSLISPFGKENSKGKIYILWSHTQDTDFEKGIWAPNHFVSCLEKIDVCEKVRVKVINKIK